MKYLVAITLPDKVAKKVRTIQESYKSSGWNISIEPHITLLPPSLALLAADDAEKVLETVAQKIKPFNLEVSGISRFRNKSNTVFCSLEDSEPLKRLHGELLHIAPAFMAVDVSALKGRPYVPHITLSNKLHDMLADQILSQLGEEDLNFKFDCADFSLYKKDDGDKLWQRVKTFSLK